METWQRHRSDLVATLTFLIDILIIMYVIVRLRAEKSMHDFRIGNLDTRPKWVGYTFTKEIL